MLMPELEQISATFVETLSSGLTQH